MTDVLWRLSARTMTPNLTAAVEHATAPFQYAMSTRAKTECIADALQPVAEADREATVASTDGYRGAAMKSWVIASMVLSAFGRKTRNTKTDEKNQQHQVLCNTRCQSDTH